jgi:hypothetical protein
MKQDKTVPFVKLHPVIATTWLLSVIIIPALLRIKS